MDRDLRASLIASGGAAILSFIVGLISRVDFLPLVLRALGGGLVFGALIYGATVLLKRFLPELFDGSGGEAGVSELGSSVDIVLPGDLPGDLTEGSDSLYDGSGDPEAKAEAASQRKGRKPQAAADPEGEAEDLEDLSLSGESLLDDAPAPERPAPELRVREARAPDGLDDLDVLPDLDSFSGSFSAINSEAGASASPEIDMAPPRSSKGGGGGPDGDPMVLAQAVRTLLKRDQER